MNEPKEYMMLLRNTDWDKGLAIGETERIIALYTEWFERLAGQGKITGGRPLLGGGRVISRQGDKISDGPFIESKETIGGYFSLKVADLDEARAIAATFPTIPAGVVVELREFARICPVSQRLEEKLKAGGELSPA